MFQRKSEGSQDQVYGLPQVGCLVSKDLHIHSPDFVVMDEDGMFQAFTGYEPPGFEDDPDNFELWSTQALLAADVRLEEFIRFAKPGDCLTLADGEWTVGRVET